jgi:SHS2 domain-containing protein
MSYTLRDHTADLGVDATGTSLGAVFAAVADGMAAAQCEAIPESGERFSIEEHAESREALLFEYLDRLIYERDVRNVLPTDHEATVTETDTGWRIQGSARGVPLEEIEGREIKAVTYSEMVVEHRDGEWYAYVVLDV